MKQRWLLVVAMSLLLMAGSITSRSQTPPTQAPPDGTVECHNFIKDGKKPNCVCWGRPNSNNPYNPECKPPQGEDPKCTNHCKSHKCKCKSPCQS